MLEKEKEEEEAAACVQAWNLVYASALPMLVRAACELGIPDILHAAREPLSAFQIAQTLHSHDSSLHPNIIVTSHHLDRLMRCLSAHDVFKASPCETSQSPTTLYLPTPLSNWLLHHPLHHPSLRGYLMFFTSPTMLLSWYHLAPFISHGDIEPFQRAHSMGFWEYTHTHPPFSSLLNEAMSSDTMSLRALLTHYHGFAHIETLVDVGGGVGTAASHIVSFYPSLNVTCFDLPHVIAMAPTHPGVKFVGGDMFQKIPNGDAIFMKWILHDWSDEDCLKILENCHRALLGKSGKLIIMDAVLETSGKEKHTFSTLRTFLDISMLVATKGGKERTKKEWELLLDMAKFSLHRVIDLPCPQSIIEAFPV